MTPPKSNTYTTHKICEDLDWQPEPEAVYNYVGAPRGSRASLATKWRRYLIKQIARERGGPQSSESAMFWNSSRLSRIVDHFPNEGKHKLWSFIAESIGGERVRDFVFTLVSTFTRYTQLCMAMNVPTRSARPCLFNSSFLHSPFFGVSFARLHFGGMAKMGRLAKDVYTIRNKIVRHALLTR